MGTVNIEDLVKNSRIFKQRRIGVNSKSKGKSGEYSIVNFLNKISGHNFMRTPSSGAHVGASNRDRLLKMTKGQIDILLGDLICPENTKFRWIIECKNYKEVPIHLLLGEKQECKEISEFINQLEHDVNSVLQLKIENRIHLSFLFLKITRKGEYIVFNKKYWFSLFKDLKINNYIQFNKKSEIPDYGNEYIITDSKMFLENNKTLLF